jgi:RNA polymerase sigma-70 factor (ECF subfamily)
VEADEQRAFLWRQIDELPESYRVLVMLRYQQGLAYEEIATVMSLPLGTVKTGLFRARARLREALREFQESPV